MGFLYIHVDIFISNVCACVFNSLASPSSLISSFVFLSFDPLHRFQSLARLKQLKERIPILADLGELSPLYILPTVHLTNIHQDMYRIFRSISRTFYQEILLEIFDMRLVLRNARKGGSYRRFHACAYPRAIGGSMATKRCSYTAAFKLNLASNFEHHFCVLFAKCAYLQCHTSRLLHFQFSDPN